MNAQRKRSLWLFAASTVVALVVVGVAIAISQGGDSGGSGGGKGGSPSQAARLFEGIPQRGARLGDPQAPARMVEFVDLQCPFCAQYSRDVLPDIVRRYVRTGKLQLELRPLAFLGEDSVPAAKAVASAGTQNRMWQFAEDFYANQGSENSGYVTAEFLRSIARDAGVSPQRVVAAAQSSVTPPLLTLAAKQAQQVGVSSTPSFLLGHTGQQLQPFKASQLTIDEFTGPIDAAIGQ